MEIKEFRPRFCVMWKLSIFLVAAIVLSQGFQKEEEGASDYDLWSDFADAVVASGRSGDLNSFLDKLSVYKVEDGMEFVRMVGEDPNFVPAGREAVELTDEHGRSVMTADIAVFMNSYEEEFAGNAVKITFLPKSELEGVELYSVVIWVEMADGRFHGIMVDMVWNRGDCLKVIKWAENGGVFLGREIGKKKAILVFDTLEECQIPDTIQYDYRFR
jgi:hypothetical protein